MTYSVPTIHNVIRVYGVCMDISRIGNQVGKSWTRIDLHALIDSVTAWETDSVGGGVLPYESYTVNVIANEVPTPALGLKDSKMKTPPP